MSDKIVPFNKIPNKQEALAIVRRLVADEKIALSKHAQERMSQRKVSFHQIITA
jgi:hypothetical protein